MKKFARLAVLSLSLVPTLCFAFEGGGPMEYHPVIPAITGNTPDDKAMRLRDEIESDFRAIDRLNGSGIRSCDARTGKLLDYSGSGSVPCVVIYTQSERATADVLNRYPSGTKIRGVFVAVLNIGEVKPFPRMSVGN